jgi:hypothetical protein
VTRKRYWWQEREICDQKERWLARKTDIAGKRDGRLERDMGGQS